MVRATDFGTIFFFALLLFFGSLAKGQDPNLLDEIVVQLGNEDIDAIKSASMCEEEDGLDCFLAFFSDTIRDAMNNRIQGNLDGIQVTKFTPDEKSPELVRFVLFDLEKGLIVLSFNEIMSTRTTNFSAVTLQELGDRDLGDAYTLTQNVTVLSDRHSTLLNFTLHSNDLNALKKINTICIGEGNCWIRFTKYFIEDVSENPVTAIENGEGDGNVERANSFEPDEKRPVLESFTVDFDTGNVSLYFDETVSDTSFEYRKITFTSSNKTVSINYTLTNALSLTEEPETHFSFQLDDDDVLNIKALDNFFTNEDDTFIVFSEPFITDQFDNDIETRLPGKDSLQCSLFLPDVTSPQVLSFDNLNLNDDRMTVSFNEPVSLNGINYTAFTIRSKDLDEPEPVEIRLTGAKSVRYTDTTKRTIQIDFNGDDIKSLKTTKDIADDVDNSYLVLNYGAIYDVADNPIDETTVAFKALEHTPDEDGAMLLSFILDLDTNTLELNFSDIIDVSTLSTSEISFQPSQVRGSNDPYVELSTVQSDSDDGFSVLFNLASSDVDELNTFPSLANEINNTYISITADAIDDIFGKKVVSITPLDALKAYRVIPDGNNPEIANFSINFNTETLSLTFSETVNIETIDLTQITINTLSPPLGVTLGGGIIIGPHYSTMVNIELTRDDLNSIKLLTMLAVDKESTYISITNATFKDSNGNPSIEIQAKIAEKYTPDQTSPVLLEAKFDLNEASLMLTFDEIVNVSTFTPTGVTFQSSKSLPIATYTLSGGKWTMTNSRFITVNITEEDLNEIKKNFHVATSFTNTFILLGNNSLKDMNDVGFINIGAVQVLENDYVKDTTNPELEAFTFDLNLGHINLTFSETVDSTTLNISQITLLAENGTNSDDLTHVLVSGKYPSASQTFSPNGTVIIISIGSDDLNEIKRLFDLATDPYNTFISLPDSAIQDMNDNSLVPVTEEDPLMADVVVPDITNPELENFSLDLNEGILSMTFSETVNVSSLLIRGLTVYGGSVDLGESYTLKTSIAQETDAVEIDVKLSDEDLNRIKFIPDIATNVNNTFLNISNGAIHDMSNNLIIDQNKVFKVNPLIPDNRPPELAEFDLDLDAGLLTLTFSEVINSTTLVLKHITIQDDGKLPNYNFSLSGGNISGSNDAFGHPPVLKITLRVDDLNEIKRLSDLAYSNKTTFLSIKDGSVDDLAPQPNELKGRPRTDALKVSFFQEDISLPHLVSIYLNLTSEHLLLVFNETMDLESLNVSEIAFQSKEYSDSPDIVVVSLEDTKAVSQTDSTEILLMLSFSDLNEIKLEPDLCTTEENCFLVLSDTTVFDMNNNPVVEIFSVGKIVDDVYEDKRQPGLYSSTLDMDEGTLLLSFTEPVNISSLKIDEITLTAYPGANESDLMHTFTSGDNSAFFTRTESESGLEILLQIGDFDRYEIQRKYLLASNISNSYISIREGAVLDMNRNQLLQVNEELITVYYVDESAPEFVSFTLDLNTGVISLTFDETVNASSLLPNKLNLRTSKYPSPPSFFLSPETTVVLQDSTIINITLTDNDLNMIKVFENLGTEENDTYLHMQNGAIKDYSSPTVGKPVEATTRKASEIFEDISPPVLQRFYVNLNASTLFLTFSEPIDVDLISYEDITLQGDTDKPYSKYKLTNGSSPSMNGLQVTIYISDFDLNEIKSQDDLFISINTSFLSYTEDAFTDMSGVSVKPRNESIALQAYDYISDSSRPYLLEFHFDMDSGQITLFFSETVNASSIDFTAITLSQDPDLDLPYYELMDGYLISEESTTLVVFNVTHNDLNIIKEKEIGVSPVTAYITLTEDAILDMTGNPVYPITGYEATLFEPDETHPSITSFDLDLTNETLTIYFSETVRGSTFEVSKFFLHNRDGDRFHTFSDLSKATDYPSTFITIQLSFEDLNNIKLDTGLATSKENTYLSYYSFAVEDMFGRDLANISEPFQVRNYTEDSVDPKITDFTLDLTNETLILTFSEVVNSSSVNPSEITLQNKPSIDENSSYVVLTTAKESENDYIITLELNVNDLNLIKQLLNLATNESNTFISFTEFTISDMNHNPVVPYYNISALQVDTLIPDTVPPTLDSFSMNLDDSIIILTFSETVVGKTLDFTKIVLQDDYHSNNSYTFQYGSVDDENSTMITVSIDKYDSDLIKEILSLATSSNNTYLRLLEDAIEDMNANEN